MKLWLSKQTCTSGQSSRDIDCLDLGSWGRKGQRKPQPIRNATYSRCTRKIFLQPECHGLESLGAAGEGAVNGGEGDCGDDDGDDVEKRLKNCQSRLGETRQLGCDWDGEWDLGVALARVFAREGRREGRIGKCRPGLGRGKKKTGNRGDRGERQAMRNVQSKYWYCTGTKVLLKPTVGNILCSWLLHHDAI